MQKEVSSLETLGFKNVSLIVDSYIVADGDKAALDALERGKCGYSVVLATNPGGEAPSLKSFFGEYELSSLVSWPATISCFPTKSDFDAEITFSKQVFEIGTADSSAAIIKRPEYVSVEKTPGNYYGMSEDVLSFFASVYPDDPFYQKLNNNVILLKLAIGSDAYDVYDVNKFSGYRIYILENQIYIAKVNIESLDGRLFIQAILEYSKK